MGGKALIERIWTLFDSWRLTPSEIDRQLCLVSGTAKRYLQMKWQEV